MSKIWGDKGEGKRIRPTADIFNSSTSKGVFLLYGLENCFSTYQKSDAANLPARKRAPAIESLQLRRQAKEKNTSALSSATMLAYLVCNSRQASRYQAAPPHFLPSCQIPCLLLEILLDKPNYSSVFLRL